MAFKYHQNGSDTQYRIASLINGSISAWMKFTDPVVEYPELCVLEVLHQDGTTTLEYERAVHTISVGRDGNLLYFPKDIPIARMWIRSNTGMAYKVPSKLLEKDGKLYILIPGNIQNVSIVGDMYFNKVYWMSIG